MKLATYSIAIACLLSLLGCAPMQMSISDDLKTDVQEYAVKGRQGILINQKLTFGNYHTTKVKRSWTRGYSSGDLVGIGKSGGRGWLDLIDLEYIDRKQTLSFGLQDSSNVSEVFTVNQFNALNVTIAGDYNSSLTVILDVLGDGVTAENMYYAQLYINNDDRPWELMLDNRLAQTAAKEYVGYFSKSPSEFYTLVPVTKMDVKGEARPILMGSIGYEIKNPQGTTVAAVSLIDKGVVYLGNRSPQERFLLANLCATLLLQEDIRD